jgi:hypothetical protein
MAQPLLNLAQPLRQPSVQERPDAVLLAVVRAIRALSEALGTRSAAKVA